MAIKHKEIGRTHGVGSLIPEGFYTRAEAAYMIGRSRDTLHRWHKSGRYQASKAMQVGKVQVWLYTDEDIEALKIIRDSIRFGRPIDHTKSVHDETQTEGKADVL